MEVVI